MHHICMIDLVGATLNDSDRVLLQHPSVGAVLLFTRNFDTPAQLTALTTAIRAIRSDIFIAVDCEGGYIQRFQRQGFRAWPAVRVYGEIYDLNPLVACALARQHGEAMARELQACGVHMSMAPVLDLHDEQSPIIAKLDRAFHTDPTVVSILASAWIEGMQAAGMPAVGKHFPGHGAVSADSHLEQPISEATIETLQTSDLVPFTSLIHQKKLDLVMPAHVVYPALDAERPAGFSPTCLQKLLREKLGFEGVIISDCLSMAGAALYGDLWACAQQALSAGCDMLIVCNQTPVALKLFLDQIAMLPTVSASAARIQQLQDKCNALQQLCLA